MSDIRRTHPGLYGVTLAVALPWYGGLGLGFALFPNSELTSARSYEFVASYVPLAVWGWLYLTLSVLLILASTVPRVPQRYVRICIGTGLAFTNFWIFCFIASLFLGQLDAVSVIPAWAAIALVEWRALSEPEDHVTVHPGAGRRHDDRRD